MNIKHLQEPYKPVFMDEEEIQSELKMMEDDKSLATKPGYIKDTPSSEGRKVSFREFHAAYLKVHPKTNPEHYLANLRAMLRIRR